MWYQVLGDLPIPTLQKAVVRWLTEVDSGFPTPAAIRRLAIESEQGLLLSAPEAFTLVLQAVSRHSPHYRAAEFLGCLPPLVRRAVEACGGPAWVADLEVADRTTYSAQFRRAYESLAQHADLMRRLPEPLRPKLANPPAETKRLIAPPPAGA